MAVEYFTFPGNGEVVRGVLTAVATLSGSGMMASAAQAAALFGFIVMLCVAVYKLDLRDSFVSLFVFLAIWMGFMVPKTSVLITESAGYGYTGKQYVVGNIPVGLAWSAHIVSSFGVNMTRKMEQIYNIPDDLNYSRTGVLFGTRLIEELRNAKIQDVTLTNDWALFMNQCSFFDINLYNKYSITDLRNSNNILELIGQTNRTLFTNVSDVKTNTTTIAGTKEFNYAGTSTSMTCIDAYNTLNRRTWTYIDQNILPRLSTRLFASMGADGIVNKEDALLNLGDTSLSYLLNNARFDTLHNIEQSAMVELIRDGSTINAQRNHNSAAVQKAFTFAQSRNQYIAAQKNGALMASWNLPLVRSVAEAILIGLFPLVLIIALMSGVMAFRTLMFYFGGLFWIQLWAPVASIINYVMTIYTKRLLSLELPYGVITPGSADNLLMAAADAQAAAGAAMWLIPVIAGALAMGGRSLLNGFMSMASGAKAGAEAAGSNTGKGNFDGGNLNYNNANANKISLNPIYTDPQMVTAQNAAGMSWKNMAAGGDFRYQARNSSLAVSTQSQISESEMYSKQAERAETAGKQYQAMHQESLAAGHAQTLAFMSTHSIGQTASNGYGVGLDATQSQHWSQINKAAQALTQKHGYSDTAAVQSALAARVGIGIGTDIGGGWNGSAITNNQLRSDIDKTAQALRESGVSIDSGFVNKVSSSSAFQTAYASGNQLARGATASYQKAEQASRSATDSFQQAQAYRENAARTYGNGKEIKYDGTNNLIADNPNLSMGQLNAGEGRTFESAIGVADKNAERLNNAAQNAGWKPNNDLTPDSRPANTIDQTHQQNAARVSAASGGNFSQVSGQAAQNGITESGVDAAIDRRADNNQQGFNNGIQTAKSDIASGKNSHNSKVDDLGKATRKAYDDTSPAMRLNDGLGNDVFDRVHNKVGQGNHDDLKHRAGSGSKTFTPKQ